MLKTILHLSKNKIHIFELMCNILCISVLSLRVFLNDLEYVQSKYVFTNYTHFSVYPSAARQLFCIPSITYLKNSCASS